MSIFNNRAVKAVILIIAIINIIAMMGFEYDFSRLGSADKEAGEEIVNDNNIDSDVGTIEAVELEKASKEKKAAEMALAKDEPAEEEPEEETDPDAPVLELTDDHISLQVGERFNYMSYIQTMEDVDGSDLSHYIYLDKVVDTSVVGDTELTYRITSTITGKSTSKVLRITVYE